MELDTLVTNSASAGMQWELFEVLADHLALTTDTRPGEVMAIDVGTLANPDELLAKTLLHCKANRN